ncbi:MAG TPA: STAS domain-containing protein [Candidatus Cybelea sp.]|jgi:anti-sigma B factor antagonist|nr:STAS domain-containing protein [Candidatus Cybelea sp.]
MTSTLLPFRPGAVGAVEQEMLAAFEDGATTVVLDLDGLDMLDANGVRALISLLRRARAAGGELALHAVKPEVLRTLSVTALDRIFPVVEERAA